jgi:hypothetical protein
LDPVALTVGLSWTLTGLLIIGLAMPLLRGRVAPNSLYGVRFRESFQSENAWYAINRYGGKRLIIWAVPLMLLGIGCFFLPLQSRPALAVIVALAPLLCVLAPACETWRFARRYR